MLVRKPSSAATPGALPFTVKVTVAASPPKSTVSVIDHCDSPAGFLAEYLANSRAFRLLHWHAFDQQALPEILCSPPDVVLMDFAGIDTRAVEFVHQLKRLRHQLPIVMAADADLGSWVRSFQAGADGFFVLPGTLQSFEETLNNAIGGWKPFPLEIQKMLVERIAHLGGIAGFRNGLTPAEREVLTLMNMGYRDKEISDFRKTSEGTIHSIKNSIFKKLNVHSAGEAIRVQSEQGFPDELRHCVVANNAASPLSNRQTHSPRKANREAA